MVRYALETYAHTGSIGRSDCNEICGVGVAEGIEYGPDAVAHRAGSPRGRECRVRGDGLQLIDVRSAIVCGFFFNLECSPQ